MPANAVPASVQALAAPVVAGFVGRTDRFRVGRVKQHPLRGLFYSDEGGRPTIEAARRLAESVATYHGTAVYVADVLALPTPVVGVVQPLALTGGGPFPG